MMELSEILQAVKHIHEQIRDAVLEACRQGELAQLAAVASETESDTIYRIDIVSEERLLTLFQAHIAAYIPIVLIGEGLPAGKVVLPAGTPESAAVWRIIVDPIDGTRGIMYQKRSAWILTGIGRNHGADSRLSHIEGAVQTEIPLLKQYLCDILWAVKGTGAQAERYNLLTGERHPLALRPSQAPTILHGFFNVCRFFPNNSALIGEIEEALAGRLLGPVQPGKAQCFTDQYLSSAGQVYELLTGHDRFVADLRPLLEAALKARGVALGLCCHPYDICTKLIADEVGVRITGPGGEELDAPLDTTSDVAWVGYANDQLFEQIQPILKAVLSEKGLLD